MATAETAYLFRHALLRDAAYQLQLPGDRARLHALAFAAIESLSGGRPATTPLASPEYGPPAPHATDPLALQLAEHALLGSPADPSLSAAHRHYLLRAADLAALRFQSTLAERLYREVAALVEGGEKGEALRRAAVAAARVGRMDASRSLLDEALPLLRQSGHRALAGIARSNLATLLSMTGKSRESEREFEAALVELRREGRRSAEGGALAGLSRVHLETGRPALAEQELEAALAIHRETRNRNGEGVELGNLGVLMMSTGRPEKALALMQEALLIHRETGNSLFEAQVLGDIAGVEWLRGHLEEAERLYVSALSVAREIGLSRTEGVVLGNLANLQAETNRLDLAAQTLQRAIELHRLTGNRRFEGAHLCSLSAVELDLGQGEKARQTWAAGAAILQEVGDLAELGRKAKQMKEACSRLGVAPFEVVEPAARAPRLTDFVRTVILGNGGSGKSWLAERLAGLAGVTVTDLDLIHWEPGGFNVRRDPAVATAEVRALAAGDAWMIEGVYGWLAQEALPRATALVLLDLPDAECVANVKARGQRRGGDDAAFAALIQWVSEYRIRRNANSFAAHEQAFEHFTGPKFRLKSREDMASLLGQLAAERQEPAPGVTS